MSSTSRYRLLKPPRRRTEPIGRELQVHQLEGHPRKTVAQQLAPDDPLAEPPEMHLSPQGPFAFFGFINYYKA